MDKTSQLTGLLADLIAKWEDFAQDSGSGENSGSDLDYSRGVAMGFGAAAQELATLLDQAGVSNSSLGNDRSDNIHQVRSDTEYYYIGFDKAPDGIWRVKHLNGVWQPDWETGADFNETVAELSQDGWTLAQFGTDLHVFQRPKHT